MERVHSPFYKPQLAMLLDSVDIKPLLEGLGMLEDERGVYVDFTMMIGCVSFLIEEARDAIHIDVNPFRDGSRYYDLCQQKAGGEMTRIAVRCGSGEWTFANEIRNVPNIASVLNSLCSFIEPHIDTSIFEEYFSDMYNSPPNHDLFALGPCVSA